MPSANQVRTVTRCLSCRLRTDRFFCHLPDEVLRSFEKIAVPSRYPAGAILFAEGEEPKGVHLLCRGQVKMSMSSPGGKLLTLRVAGPGDLLGISATLAERDYHFTAEAMEPVEVKYIERGDLLRFLQEHTEACFRAAEQLSGKYDVACHSIRALGLSHSTAEKLARFLLEWVATHGGSSSGKGRVPIRVTHEEIAQRIGASREAVTRLLGGLRRQRIIRHEGAHLEILDRDALLHLMNS